MSAMQRRKGANAERDVSNYLKTRGHNTRRFLAGDGAQPGDIDGVDGLCIEVKNAATLQIPAWIRQAYDEARDGDMPIVVAKPKGVTDVADWWAITRVHTFFDIWEN